MSSGVESHEFEPNSDGSIRGLRTRHGQSGRCRESSVSSLVCLVSKPESPVLQEASQPHPRKYDELAMLEAASMGRPLGAFFDAHACASKWDHYAEAGYNMQGATSVQTPGFLNMTLRQPFGVVAAIIPWNGPLIFFANKLAPALIVGNTVVLKSSEKAPLTSAKVAALVQQAGFPPGVINIITGFGNVSGSVLSHHMDV